MEDQLCWRFVYKYVIYHSCYKLKMHLENALKVLECDFRKGVGSLACVCEKDSALCLVVLKFYFWHFPNLFRLFSLLVSLYCIQDCALL